MYALIATGALVQEPDVQSDKARWHGPDYSKEIRGRASLIARTPIKSAPSASLCKVILGLFPGFHRMEPSDSS